MGTFGVWKLDSWFDRPPGPDAAAELERLGYDTVWLGGSPTSLGTAKSVLSATSTLTVGTSIVNIWTFPVDRLNAEYAALPADRFKLGVGVGHREHTDTYATPYAALKSFVDALTVPEESLLLAALGPRVLGLAADRAAGAIPYFTTPEHTLLAREILGPDRYLAPEHAVVLSTDPAEARAVARGYTTFYLALKNYTSNLLRLGFTEADFADGGSDRLVDELVYWGSPEQIAEKLRRHHDAGADHVAIQFIPSDRADVLEPARQLAAALF
ncbi:LLM class F420-dependent oxidoreductase [Pseudonocardiaceae bacterium YIM PH 21723]|nr:LLM class F420-dependent oxidoreductase [Pseudonocardiaceae bacterium YIM PH 21723]